MRPIHILHAAVEKVAQGDLQARAEVRSRDEIERLAEAFNDMARTILGRNQILESVSFAAKQFLSAADPDAVAPEVLERIGQATGASRAYVLKICARRRPLAPGAAAGMVVAGRRLQRRRGQRFCWQGEGVDRWVELLKGGQMVTAKPAELDPAARDSHRPADPVDDRHPRRGRRRVVGGDRTR